MDASDQDHQRLAPIEQHEPRAAEGQRVALLVIARAPSSGNSKTRLLGAVDLPHITDLPQCFLLDTLETLNQVDGAERGILYTPSGVEDELRTLAPFRPLLVQQRGTDLGERLYCGFIDLFVQGFSGAIIMNSDSPTMPAEYLRAAVQGLKLPGDRVVLGPSADGGYYLIGLKRAHCALFEGIAWSTDRVFRQTVDAADRKGLTVHILPEWYDVDTVEDLRRMTDDLSANPDASVGRHTKAWWVRHGRVDASDH